MKFFLQLTYLAVFFFHYTVAEDVESYLQQQSKTIANGVPRTMLPRGTVLMCATDEINNWFNLDGKGIGEYAGNKLRLICSSS